MQFGTDGRSPKLLLRRSRSPLSECPGQMASFVKHLTITIESAGVQPWGSGFDYMPRSRASGPGCICQAGTEPDRLKETDVFEASAASGRWRPPTS